MFYICIIYALVQLKPEHLNTDSIVSANITDFRNGHSGDNEWGQPRAYKLFSRFVFLQGLIRGSTNNTLMCVLPDGYRPPTKQIFAVGSLSNGAHVYIYPNGEVHATGNGGGYLSLGGVVFMV